VWDQVWAGNVFLGYNQTQFAYDAEGHRTHKTFNGATTRYTVNPHGLSSMSEVLIEHKPNNTKRWYVWGGPAGLLYESQTNSSGSETAVRYYHSDQVGSTLALTDASANVTGRIEYSPYGLITHATGVIDTPYLFNGAFGVQTDAETGLLHMRARYYHPWLGRFLSEDPIQFSGGNNWYAFTSGDPVFGSDPSGLTERWSNGLGNRDWYQVTGRDYAGEARQLAAMMAQDPTFVIEGVSHQEYSTFPAFDPIDAAVGVFATASRSVGFTAATATLSLPQFGTPTVDAVLASSRRAVGQTTEGARAIAKKIGHAQSGGYTSAFEGVKSTQSNADSIIENIFSNPSRTFYGDKVIDVYDATGRGVRFDTETSFFKGFIEASRATQ
jgi:RHS repeat-associated protein